VHALGSDTPIAAEVDESADGTLTPPERLHDPEEAPMARRTRRVVSKVDSLSVLRFSVLLYLSLYLVVVVAALVLWVVASVVGVVDNIESFIKGLFALESFHFDALAMFRGLTVGGLLMVLIGSGANVLVAVLYNLISDVVGGVEVTVSERDAGEPPEPRRVRSSR
jgi:uncharacterized membrane protein